MILVKSHASLSSMFQHVLLEAVGIAQGRPIPTRCFAKDFREEVPGSAGLSATHRDALFVVNLF